MSTKGSILLSGEVLGYADGGDNPVKQLAIVPGAYENASNFLKTHQETKKQFDRVSELVEGFESAFGLELLSTVHWVAKNESSISIEDIIKQVYSWNERKKQFTPRQIELSLKLLKNKQWI